MVCRLGAVLVALIMALFAIGVVASIDETAHDALILIIAFAAALASYRLTMAGCNAIRNKRSPKPPCENKQGLSNRSKLAPSPPAASSALGSEGDLDQETALARKQLGIAQSTWESFTSFQEALSGTEDETRLAIKAVERALHVDEAVEWIATGALQDKLAVWQDASIVLTDKRLLVSFASFWPGKFEVSSIEREPNFEFKQLQNLGNLARFDIRGFGRLDWQFLALAPEHLVELKERLAATAISPSSAPTSSSPIETPMAALTTIKELLDSGLITQDDYERKKKEVLDRL